MDDYARPWVRQSDTRSQFSSALESTSQSNTRWKSLAGIKSSFSSRLRPGPRSSIRNMQTKRTQETVGNRVSHVRVFVPPTDAGVTSSPATSPYFRRGADWSVSSPESFRISRDSSRCRWDERSVFYSSFRLWCIRRTPHRSPKWRLLDTNVTTLHFYVVKLLSSHQLQFNKSLFYLAHDIPDVGIVHRVARDRSRVSVEDIHQVPLLAILQHQVQLVHLSIGRQYSGRDSKC